VTPEFASNTFVQMLDIQQNMMIDIFVLYGALDWGAQKTYESRVTANRSVKSLTYHKKNYSVNHNPPRQGC